VTKKEFLINKNELPYNWDISPIVNISTVIMGQSPPSSTYNADGDGLPFFQGKGEFGSLYPKARKWCSTPSKIAKKNDVLISVRAPVGPTNLAPSDCCIGRGLAAIQPDGGIPSKYVLYYLRSIESEIESLGTGTTFKAISGSILRSLSIPIAPPNEQKRIVAEIEKQFSRLDEATAAMKRIKENLKRYKASVLKAAVEGNLTEEWRKAYSKKKNIVFPWPNGNLKNFTSKVGSGATPRGGKNAYKIEGIPLIRSMNIHFPRFQFEGLAFIDNKQAKQLDNVIVKTDDVLLNITGASIGRVTKAPKAMEGGRVNQHVCIIRPTSDINPDFLSIFLASPIQQRYIDEIQVGATRQALTKSMILNFEIPLPHIDEQKAIVEIAEKHISILEEVGKEVDNNTTRTERLLQSILKKAFSGKLVLHDPNDEPASLLLARIKNQRELQKKTLVKKREHTYKEVIVMAKEKISILEVLKRAKRSLTPEELFRQSGYSIEEVEDFYAELKKVDQEGVFTQEKKKNGEVFLKVAK
jgi:type I restriction enzyme S subunit